MILHVPTVEGFTEEAREAGVIRVYVTLWKELRGAGFVVRDGEAEMPCAKT